MDCGNDITTDGESLGGEDVSDDLLSTHSWVDGPVKRNSM